MDRLITARDLARREGAASVDAWIRATGARLQRRGVLATVWDGRTVEGEPVAAIVDHGRLLALCECGGTEYVSEERRIFFCHRCGNGGATSARPVSFPDDWEAVKTALLARPVVTVLGRDEVERMFFHKPTDRRLTRDWRPGESAESVQAANEPEAPVEEEPILEEQVGEEPILEEPLEVTVDEPQVEPPIVVCQGCGDEGVLTTSWTRQEEDVYLCSLCNWDKSYGRNGKTICRACQGMEKDPPCPACSGQGVAKVEVNDGGL